MDEDQWLVSIFRFTLLLNSLSLNIFPFIRADLAEFIYWKCEEKFFFCCLQKFLNHLVFIFPAEIPFPEMYEKFLSDNKANILFHI